MIAGIVTIICLAALYAQHRHHVFSGIKLQSRVEALEHKQAGAFDPKAFSDLQSKVEALRLGRSLGGK